MKKLISLMIVLCLILAMAPAAFADSNSGGYPGTPEPEHHLTNWREVRSATETAEGLMRRWCTDAGCKYYEEMKTEKLPNVYWSEARDSEKLRTSCITGALPGGYEELDGWTCTQMSELLQGLTDRHFSQYAQVKYCGVGIGSFDEDNLQTIGLPKEQFERLMAAREDLCLQLTTGFASVVLDVETTEELFESIEDDLVLSTVPSKDGLTVSLLADGKEVSVPMSIMSWCKEDGKYLGTADSELGLGADNGEVYVVSYTEAEGTTELEYLEHDGDVPGYGWLNYRAGWKHRLGEKFWG